MGAYRDDLLFTKDFDERTVMNLAVFVQRCYGYDEYHFDDLTKMSVGTGCL